MDEILIPNLVNFSKNLSNINEVLLYLIQENIISPDDCERIIEKNVTTLSKNSALVTELMKKDLNILSIFFSILHVTSNTHLASALQDTVKQLKPELVLEILSLTGDGNEPDPSKGIRLSKAKDLNINQSTIRPSGLFGNDLEKPSCSSEFRSVIWWPEEKTLLNNFYERKVGENSFVQLLMHNLEKNENKTAVISQNVALSGLGGVGKTTTAIWFAVSYQNKYDRIIWIDCGEENLCPCFQKLAKYLGADDSQDLKQLAFSSFEKLAGQKCLLIYDNAEGYIGKEGIKDVMPTAKYNFHCLITSRSSHWRQGGRNLKIIPFEVQVFEGKDSVEFLKKNLSRNLKIRDILKLKELADLLGHLPLALQIAVATLNDGDSLTLEDYVKRINVTDEIIQSHYDVDDYEKSIYNALKVSLEKIQKMENGEMAYKILTTFGYLRPDDAKLDFFAQVENELVEMIDYSVDLLTKFSLVTRTGVMEYYVTEDIDDDTFAEEFDPDDEFYSEKRGKVLKQSKLISIHRLLQQVIRYHSKEMEREILTKTLQCKGFLDSKLIPYKYTEKHKGLSEEFKHVRNELIYDMEIKAFWKERRYTEAAELSKLIHANYSAGSTKHLSSLYNYAVCLVMNDRWEEALKIFENLYLKARHKNKLVIMELINLEEVVNKYAVALWCIQLHLALGHPCLEVTTQRLKLQELNKMNSIEIRGHLLPFNFKIFDNLQIKHVELKWVKIIWDSLQKNISKSSSLKKFQMETLYFRYPIFLDNDGEMMDEVEFGYVAVASRKLSLDTHKAFNKTPTLIRLDISKIDDIVETLTLHGLQIHSSGHNFNIKFLMLRNLYNSQEEINDILPKFKNLLKLTLQQDAGNFFLNLSKIPVTVKRLHLFSIINVMEDQALDGLELETLSLKGYDVSKLEVMKTLTTRLNPHIVNINLVWGSSPGNLIARKEGIKNLIELGLRQQSSIAFGGYQYASMDLITHLDLQIYGIQENSNYYFIEGLCGKPIDAETFDKMSEQDW